MKLQINEGMEWIRFIFLFRQDEQDYQEFFACGEGFSAEGRIILSILLILSKLFSLKKESIPPFSN
jgi:hypothetical protein